MNKNISVLMDGELFDDEVDACLGNLRRDSDARKNWAVYHLVGDVMRQPGHIQRDISAAVHQLIQEEPTVLAPRSQRVQLQSRNFAMSAAATLAAIGVVAWMSLQINPESTPQMSGQRLSLRPASMLIKPSANEYLMAHQEFSPSTDMNGGASYIRIVSYNSDAR